METQVLILQGRRKGGKSLEMEGSAAASGIKFAPKRSLKVVEAILQKLRGVLLCQ